MPVITISPPRGYVSASPRLIDFSTGLNGAEAQRLRRLGTRFALDVELPNMREGPELAALISDIMQARDEGARYPWPQPGLTIGTPGSPVVNGAGQTGMSLVLSGFAGGYTVRKGQFFSVTVSGRDYLYQFAAAGTASGGGALTASIFPMLRRSPANGAALDLNPMIEGDISRDNAAGYSWQHDRDDQVPLRFSIEEMA